MILFVCGTATLCFSGLLFGQTGQADPDCPFFGPDRERFFTDALRRSSGMGPSRRLSATTEAAVKMMGFVPGGSRTYNFDQAHAPGSIDSYIFADFQANGITPRRRPRTGNSSAASRST